MTGLRIIAFGDPGGSVWGAAVQLGGIAVVAAARGRERHELAAGPIQQGEDWRVEGEGLALTLSPAQEPAGPAPPPEEDRERGAQPPAHRHGVLSGRLGSGELDCPAIGAELPEAEVEPLASARAAYAWFPDGHALAALALRGPDANGHEADRLYATLFEPERTVAVADPRMSTTYGADGMPRRVSLELWVQEGEEEYPRRGAGEAREEPLQARLGDLRLTVVPMSCHGRGEDGSGLYLMLSR